MTGFAAVRRLLSVAAGWLLPLHAALAGIVSPVLECTHPPAEYAMPADGLTLTSAAVEPMWVRLEERGHGLVPRADGIEMLSVPVPFRFGFHYVLLPPGASVRLHASSGSAAKVAVAPDCQADRSASSPLGWMRDAAALSPQRFLSAEETEAGLARLAVLGKAASGPAERALVAHLRAQTLLLGGRSADAADGFAAAGVAWLRAGDAARARVAAVGQVEELLRLGRHAEVPALVDPIADDTADRDYFAARLKLSGCLALRYAGRMDEALPCFARGVARMRALNETLDAVSAMQDMADVRRFLGDMAGAEALGHEALEMADGPQMQVHRGRIALMLVELAEDRGDIEATLAWLDRALVEFASANAVRWEANALLAAADFYIALEALEEASDLIGAAMRRLSARDAPARVAAAQVRQARIALGARRFDRAGDALRDAEETLARLEMPAELDTVRVLQAHRQMLLGDAAAAQALHRTRDAGQTINQREWRLLEAEIAAALGDCGRAGPLLEAMAGAGLLLAQEIRRLEASARCLVAQGRQREAHVLLGLGAEKVGKVARHVQSGLLRQMLAPHVVALRRAAYALGAVVPAGTRADAAEAWNWLQYESEVRLGGIRAPSGAALEDFDAHVAKVLLRGTDARDAERGGSARSLLAALSQATPAAQREHDDFTRPRLADLQRRLDPDALFLSLIEAGPRSQLVWVARDGAGVLAAADPAQWRHRADRLAQLAADPATPVNQVRRQAAELAGIVLPPSGLPVPRQLWVDASSPLASLAWPLLPWPGAQPPAQETMRVSLVHARLFSSGSRLAPADVEVFTSSGRAEDSQEDLFNAGSEPALIARAMSPHGRQVRPLAGGSRVALIEAFERPRSWLHIASHGSADATRLGYAGVWLDRSGDAAGAPAFVSSLEILARGADSELVVLNACRLADQSARWSSFAEAVARAGARNVVAARWQVSDGAATTWVPAFYDALAHEGDVGRALAAAQGRLRESRSYRHPAYWASFVHFGSL